MTYNVSDFIDDSMTAYSIWSNDCQEGGNSIPPSILEVTKSGFILGDVVDGKRETSLSIVIQPETVQSSVLYSDNNAIRDAALGEALIAEINFCVRFSVQTAGIYSTEVNFQETLVTMTIDFSEGFNIHEITTETNLCVTTTTNNVYDVDSYDCSGGLLPPIGAELEGEEVKNQGAEIRVCIEPNADALRDGIYIRQIQSFTFTRGNITQDSVVDGTAANNGLSRLVCTRGTPLCYFETILKADFYTTQGVVDATGVIILQFGTSSSRRLGGTSHRNLQQDDAAGVAEVEIEFEVGEHLVGTANNFWLGGIVGSSGDMPAGAKSGIAVLGFLSFCATALLFMQLPRFKSSRYYV